MAAPQHAKAMTGPEGIAWIFFAITSIQLAVQHPSWLLVAGERTNLFSGLLCFFTLAAAVLASQPGTFALRSPEVLISAALALMAVISGAFSFTPLSSSFRVFVLLTSSLGGFWCARILVRDQDSQRRLVWLCLWILVAMLVLCFLGYFLTGYIEHFICDRSHPVTNVILLLSFAPLALLGEKSRRAKVLGMVILALSYVTLCLSERISVVFIPLGVCLAGALFGTLRWKYFVILGLVMAMLVGVFHEKIIWRKLSLAYPSYRIENFPFSWSIARKHPWIGIGLRTPRIDFLEGYQVKYPGLSQAEFTKNVSDLVSADNTLLTLLVGLGIPFTLTFLAAVSILLARLTRMVFRPPPGLAFHPLVLLFPLVTAMVHFLIFDGLLFLQSCWFFSMLLGLIPAGRPAPGISGPEDVR
jgi:hypothetical protein